MKIGEVFCQSNIIMDMKSTEKDEAFEELVEVLAVNNSNINREQVLDMLRTREQKMTTGIIHGVAVPHAVVPCLKGNQVCGALGISRSGIEYDAYDGSPVYIMFLLLAAPEATQGHLGALKQLSIVLQAPGFCQEILQKESAKEVFDTLNLLETKLS